MTERTTDRGPDAAEADQPDRRGAARSRELAGARAVASPSRAALSRPRPRWIMPTVTAFAGAAIAIAVMLFVRPAPARGELDAATEAVGDHLRVLTGRGLGVEVSDMHQVKPWFAGKLDFVPPVSFLGDDDFPLAGGDVAIFGGHKSAVFVYHRHRHVISLFVFVAADVPTSERTVQGFHALTWGADGFGFALVSDVNFDDLRSLRSRVH